MIHRLSWQHGDKFHDICDRYCKLVRNQYGCAKIVFDGYSSTPTTKDQTHQRRSKGIKGTKVLFDQSTVFKTKKEKFLSNAENKQNFINLLASYLSSSGCIIIHAKTDADVQIVEIAIIEADKSDVVVIGEDTDLLVLLCAHAKVEANTIYFTSDTKASQKVKKIWNIKNTT